MKIYVKKVERVTLPEKGSPVSAGYDVVATSEPKIVGEPSTLKDAWKRIDYIEYETNLFIAPSSVSFHTLIHPRSSVSKYNLVLANSVGLVDNDYRGMVICRFKYQWQPEDMWWGTEPTSDPTARKMLFGNLNLEKIYKKGDKIAQLVAEPTVTVEWEFVDNLTQTQRGEGGFGSTDKSGKPLTEVFAEEKARFEARKSGTGDPTLTILDKFKQTVASPTHVPYSELIKQRESGR